MRRVFNRWVSAKGYGNASLYLGAYKSQYRVSIEASQRSRGGNDHYLEVEYLMPPDEQARGHISV